MSAASRKKVWTLAPARPAKPGEAEKGEIIAACETLIRDVLRPRFLPEIRPTAWTYPVDIRGAWSGGRYRFILRFRSDAENRTCEEFDAPFARIDRMGRDRFDVYWMRHTGTWWRLHSGKTLAEALHLVETDGHLHPPA